MSEPTNTETDSDDSGTGTSGKGSERKHDPSIHKFRYLLPPGNNFSFVTKFRTWIIMSFFLMAGCIGMLFVNKARHGDYMNWTIDFKGGTEIIFAFADKAKSTPEVPVYVKVDPAKAREALEKAGEEGFDVSDIGFPDDKARHIDGMIVRSPRFSALKPAVEKKAQEAFLKEFEKLHVTRASWSGDRLFVKVKDRAITNAEAAAFFKSVDPTLEVKPWSAKETDQYTHADEGTGEYSEVFGMWGLDRQYEQMFEAALDNVDAIPYQSYGVGAKAGDKLRNDAAKAIIYAIFLIMLYLAFRFDIRYAPGAAFASIHDAIMVIGVFALTWTEVSLTSVAGLLTVMGYSVNDTVIVFDRIRENQAKLKDKKIERIIDISINEMLTRTILTTSTVFATTLVMNIFGEGLVQNFAFAMNVGVIVGTYSSIFLAAPIFMYISKKWYSGPAPARRRAAPIAAASTPSAPSAEDE